MQKCDNCGRTFGILYKKHKTNGGKILCYSCFDDFNKLNNDIYITSKFKKISENNDSYNSFKISNENEDIHPAIKELNEKQRNAVLCESNNVLVLAGAGSGKTRTLIQKILYLLSEKKVNPSEIMSITFTRNAANEMLDRLIIVKDPEYKKIIYDKNLSKNEKNIQRKKYISKYSWLKFITVNTFHSVCYSILRTYGARIFDNKFKILLAQSYDDEIPDKRTAPETQPQIIHKSILKLSEDVDFLLKLKRYILDYYVDSYRLKMHLRGRIDFEKPYTTLREDHVRSKSERDIADWLYRHNIDYVYEPLIGPDEFQFKPDFFIPNANLYLEHVSNISHPLKDKIEQMKKAGKTYVRIHEELTHDSKEFNDTLERIITPHLHGDINKITALKFEEEFQGFEKYLNFFVFSIMQVIDKIKVENKDFYEIFNRAINDVHERIRLFYEIMKPIYEDYIEYCKNCSYLDFNDLIIMTIDLFKSNEKFKKMYQEKFKYVLVDEFQDVNTLQVELLNYFRDENTQLFCVGDDWQSIYGWRGSEVEYIIKFSDYFENPEIIKLSLNYRSNDTIVEASNEVIKNNKYMVEKNIKALKESSKKIYIYSSENECEDGVARTVEKVKQYLDRGYDKKEILILTRTRKSDAYYSYREELKKIGVSLTTMHQAKGLEAKVVFITGLTGGYWGFPNVRDADRIFQYIKESDFELLMEEERRLFYVALTRAKEDLFLITEMGNESQFIWEIPEKLLDSENFLLFDLSKNTELICKSCGNTIKNEFQYCPYCGIRTSLKSDTIDKESFSHTIIKDDEIGITILKCLSSIEGQVGRSLLSQILLGSKSKKIMRSKYNENDFYGSLNGFTQEEILKIIDNLIDNSFIRINDNNPLYPLIDISPKSIGAIYSNEKIPLNINFSDKNKDEIKKTFTVEEVRKKYPNAYIPWNEREDADLERDYRQGKNIEELAIIFQRSYGSIKSRLFKLGLIEKNSKQENTTNQYYNPNNLPNSFKPWTKEEDEILTKEWLDGLSNRKIAIMLGRSISSINSRVLKLKIYELKDEFEPGNIS